ncbi:QsdR family transcriptional regulator [Vitiosangium sp. GDMCC 1.1324]|uniref:QsdR family transcriptional regulator n=1 Tax=Vitiosangium sp. (strain GDMCC 1.1324) TaxID=2138576 RepID=UPI00130ED09C|nr:QsdR family transcriptional regulator [Vitiosangium sp. GDMCC 1.1324]
MKRSRESDRPAAPRRPKRPSRTTRHTDAEQSAPVTPLTRRLEAPTRATPQELFALALDWWMKGERFDIGRMAQELGVSRATVFRWVGTRELLYGEVISAQFEAAMATARDEATGEGAELIANIVQRMIHLIVENEPLKKFVQQDAEYAMRILMSKSSTVEQRNTACVRKALEDGVRDGHIRPEMDLDALAFVIIRIGESFLYRDAITGDPPDIQSAITAIRILVTAEKRNERWTIP